MSALRCLLPYLKTVALLALATAVAGIVVWYAPLDSVSAYDSYASVNSLINLLANAFLHETLDSGRPRIHDIATLYQQLDELEQR